MLTFVGLGLFDEKDMSLKALECLRSSDLVFAEFYTSRLIGSSIEKLEKLINKKIIVLNREAVESGNVVISAAKTKNVAFIAAGDSMIATTHISLRLKAVDNGIETFLIHGASIHCALSGALGLQNYKFGKTVTIPFPDRDFYPQSVYDSICSNMNAGLHTLVLLDLKDNQFLTAKEALLILEEMEKRYHKNMITNKTLIAVVSQIGSKNQVLNAGTIADLKSKDLGPPMHSLVVLGTLHFIEEEALVKLAHMRI